MNAARNEQRSWPLIEHERLRVECGAPLSARMTAIAAWRASNPEWKAVSVEIGDANELLAAIEIGHRPRFAWTEALLLGPQDEPACIPGRNTASVRRLAGAVRQTLDNLHRPWVLRLANLPLRDPNVTEFLADFANVRMGSTCDAVHLRLSPGMSRNAATTRNARAAVAKARNRIAGDGRRLTLAWLQTESDIFGVLPDVLNVHKLRLVQLRAGRPMNERAVYAEFTERIAAHAREGSVRLLVARIDDEIAAFALCLLDRPILHVYANVVAPKWLRYSAGTIANHEVVTWALQSGEVDVVDWGLGVQRYKLSGPTELVPYARFEIYSSIGAKTAVATARRMRSGLRIPRARVAASGATPVAATLSLALGRNISFF